MTRRHFRSTFALLILLGVGSLYPVYAGLHDFNTHGGVSYIRDLDGDKEILLATEVKPRAGPWVQFPDEIWEYVPDNHEHVYYPDSLRVQTWEDESEFTDQNPSAWPFGQQIQLRPKPESHFEF